MGAGIEAVGAWRAGARSPRRIGLTAPRAPVSNLPSDEAARAHPMPTEDQHARPDPFAAAGLDPASVRRQLAAAIARLCPRWPSSERDDLVQGAMVRLLEALARAPERGLNATYIRMTAHAVTLDELRRARRRHERTDAADLLDASPAPPGSDGNPHRARVGRELQEAVRECLARLVPPRRRAVLLHFFGYLPAEAGRVAGWDAKRAANLIYRGLADLRLCLAEKGHGR